MFVATRMAATLASAMKALEGSAMRPVREALVDWARRTGVDEMRRSSRRAGALRMFLILTECGGLRVLPGRPFGKVRMDRVMTERFGSGTGLKTGHYNGLVAIRCGRRGESAQTKMGRYRAGSGAGVDGHGAGWRGAGVGAWGFRVRPGAGCEPVRAHGVEGARWVYQGQYLCNRADT